MPKIVYTYGLKQHRKFLSKQTHILFRRQNDNQEEPQSSEFRMCYVFLKGKRRQSVHASMHPCMLLLLLWSWYISRSGVIGRETLWTWMLLLQYTCLFDTFLVFLFFRIFRPSLSRVCVCVVVANHFKFYHLILINLHNLSLVDQRI